MKMHLNLHANKVDSFVDFKFKLKLEIFRRGRVLDLSSLKPEIHVHIAEVKSLSIVQILNYPDFSFVLTSF